ncbi:PREDICTED: uncharacterized protein LOC106747236 [Dinoponera quadriceps]|uniref:Uncharacterized protein LOC106747236 n=1 Tax=Dinoponera quadriceps TaxID=609295 RepID=A0A6P3XQ31_DINQU|nr:PREDICTED: uncharacterized protein LOC106747236 [Dinoponera quadriceps]
MNRQIIARESMINSTVKYLLILFGIWPDISYVVLCRVYWSMSLTIILVWQYQYLLVHFYTNDLFDLMDWFSTFIGFMKLFFKIVVFWWNQRIFNRILKIMAEDWKNCANSDIEMSKAVNNAKISDYIANAMISLHTLAVLFYGIGIMLDDVDLTDPTIEIPHIYKIEFPFNIKTQSTYKFVLFTEMIQLIISSWVMGIINTMLLILTIHIGGQIDILCCWLTELVSVEDTNNNRTKMMEKIIQKHQKIIYFTENIENLYTFIALMQFATNVLMICLLGFLIITALGNPDATGKIMRSLSLYSVTNVETFIFCYAGEYLINKSKAIGYAAYDTAWYDMEPKQCRILLFIILRSQKQLTLTIGKLMDLSLQRFASVTNTRVLMKNIKVIARKSTINCMVKYLLILYGIWPNTLCALSCKVFWSVSLAIIQVYHCRYLLVHFYSNDVFDLMDCFSTFIGFIKLFFKIIVFWWKQEIFNRILKSMTEDWKDCANNDIEMRKAISNANLSHYIANAIIGLHTVAVLFYGIGIILNNVDLTDTTIQIPHIYKIEFPFNIQTQSTYKFVLITELIQLTMSSWGMGVINALLLVLALDNPNAMEKIMRSLSYYSVTNLEAFIFCYAGEYLINKSKAIGNAAYDTSWYSMEPKHCRILLFIILRSQKQLTLTIGKMMNLSLQQFANALDNPNAMEKIMRSLLYFSVTNLEAFIFCYAGEYLINKSKAIGNAAYDTSWYNMELKQCRIILFIILRSQKQLILTTGKMMNLSLQQFVNIMSSAGSYISVLLAMQ